MAIRLPSPLVLLTAAFLFICGLALAVGAAAPARADHHAEGHAAHAADEASDKAKEMAADKASDVVLYEPGVHYEELLVPVSTLDPSKVEVDEMFSYGCIHCFNFDAAVSEWASRQDDGVIFTRVPAIFNKAWQMLAQAYYTAEALGVSDKTHDALFAAIHTYNKDLRTPEAIGEVFKEAAGVKPEAFMKAFNSFSVRSKVQQADSRARQVRLSSVPTLVVNGKYKTNSTLAGTNVGMLQVVDFLIKKEQAAAKAKQSEAAAE